MCGRFVLYSKKNVYEKYNIEINKSYNITPGNKVLILNSKLKPIYLKWGLNLSRFNKSINVINARIETLTKNNFFKNTLRCIFLVDGYFEWKLHEGKKIPYYHFIEKSLLHLAGIYHVHFGCAIVTKKSINKIAHIHDRQPLILEDKYFHCWINKICDLKFTKHNDNLEIKAHKVTNLVNNPINDSIKNIYETA